MNTIELKNMGLSEINSEEAQSTQGGFITIAAYLDYTLEVYERFAEGIAKGWEGYKIH
jgi:hypothetical protein